MSRDGACLLSLVWRWSRAKFCSQLCSNISTVEQVLVLAKESQEFISARPKTSCLIFIRITVHGLEDSSKKVKNTNKLATQADLAELICHRESCQNN